ncbi:hypothetical protein AX16_006589 [Volvariella volvacea WC 439]|nr:hypothetical protein AX16_006589 [Volvariella volvacea WC 439]
MRDGPSKAELSTRANVLVAYRAYWPELRSTYVLPIVTHQTRYGVSGGFFHEILNLDQPHPHTALALTELGSHRLGRPPATPRRIIHSGINPIACVAVDNNQSLIVAASLIENQIGQMGLYLDVRDMINYNQHPSTASPFHIFNIQTLRPRSVNLSIGGGKVLVTFEYVVAEHVKIKHLLVDWRNYASKWFEEQDMCFLNDRYAVSIPREQNGGLPTLRLYDITSASQAFIQREYNLPEEWRGRQTGVIQNKSVMHDLPRDSDALFSFDPIHRILVLTARDPSTSQQWLVIKESSLIRYANHSDSPSPIPWEQWRDYCFIANIPITCFKPEVVGTRVVWFNHAESKMDILSFDPVPPTNSGRLQVDWAWRGPRARSGLVPYGHENPDILRRSPSPSNAARLVEAVRITEDSVVILYRSHQIEAYVHSFGPRPLQTP